MHVLSGDLLENYTALWVAIEYNIDSPETAFQLLDKILEDPYCRNRKKKRIYKEDMGKSIRETDLTEEDTRNMIKLREQRVLFKDIGLMYGLTHQAVQQRIKYYQDREARMSIQKIDTHVASKIIKNREPKGLFYTIEKHNGKNIYVAIDNLHGDAWTEDFKNLDTCKRWLIGGGRK